MVTPAARRKLNRILDKWMVCAGKPHCWGGSHVRGCPWVYRPRAERVALELAAYYERKLRAKDVRRGRRKSAAS